MVSQHIKQSQTLIVEGEMAELLSKVLAEIFIMTRNKKLDTLTQTLSMDIFSRWAATDQKHITVYLLSGLAQLSLILQRNEASTYSEAIQLQLEQPLFAQCWTSFL
jgi:hypothetical protein